MTSLATFWDSVTLGGRRPCFVCGLWPGERSRCEGRSGGIVDAHHVIAKSFLRREFPRGARRALEVEGPVGMVPGEIPGRVHLLPDETPAGSSTSSVWEAVPRGWEFEPRWDVWLLDEVVGDPRNGVTVRRWHHDALEARRLVIPRAALPAGVEEFACELGLGWLLDRNFGPRDVAA